MSLTPKQKKVYEFILRFLEEQGYAPSQREIAEHFGFSSLGTVQDYLSTLKRGGYLEQGWNAKRDLRIAGSSSTLPLLGKVAAGRPIEALLDGESVMVPPSFLNPQESYFALQVSGDSMVGDGICDGDIVVIKKQSTARNGDTVVALINNEATIKRFYKKRNQVELHAANPKYKPIVVAENEEFKIEGILSGLIRRFQSP